MARRSGETWGEITLRLADDAVLRDRKRRHFGLDETTDVISFRIDPVPGETPRPCGDLLVNVECAVREGARRRGGADEELALYIAHGLHHLSGAEDRTPDQRRAMRRVERRWLGEVRRAGMVRGLVEDDHEHES
ncbi:rRNA maturation RNase YbeY [Kiritimatiella glycovorans]|uniref:Endoribonuclease YbeY n=1 Tax=Kiritimatiella glycovorans TaxID=1307763 RepID=A0A0G3ED24_9BACT|nr:rRNA maturation RNase YbeY [Kiritimatiella glycovorans]AKJ64213.1 Endoribonuclease YbeY [Kiritimatiella glycovorans]